MVKNLLILFCISFILQANLFCQNYDCYDNTIVQNELYFSGVYGLADFNKSIYDMPVGIRSLVISFYSNLTFNGQAGNSHSGAYYISDSNKIIFRVCSSTAAGIAVKVSSGNIYNCDLYMDTLVQCNRFQLVKNEIKLYRDSIYKMTLKPYIDLLGFSEREGMENKTVKVLKVSSIDNLERIAVIDSQDQFDSLHVDLNNQIVDFSKESIVIIENIGLQDIKQKNLRDLAKRYKKREQSNIFPVSYAKLYIDTNLNTYLDIVNTYTRPLGQDRIRSGRYSGFTFNKISGGKININITYTQ